MFVGEAPGRLGADSSQIPFHGDQAGHNFESFLVQAGISRYDVFVTNAVLCNPRDENGNNSSPSKVEIHNCSEFLRRQIDLVNPSLVVTLGNVALSAASAIEKHSFGLARNVRALARWYGRRLIPIYHPGQRALLHRSFANQLADYQFVAEALRRPAKNNNRPATSIASQKTVAVVQHMLSQKHRIGYFALHKLFYLIEVEAIKRLGRRITDSYIVRQKDGPYCVDLHFGKLRKHFPSLTSNVLRERLSLETAAPDLFPEQRQDSLLSDEERELVSDVMRHHSSKSDTELKRRTYLTIEMRAILRAERHQRRNMFNVPLLGPSHNE